MAAWQFHEAQSRLSELIERVQKEGPQTITRQGAEHAVILSIEDYQRLLAHRPDFTSYLLGGPKVDNFEVERDQDIGRINIL